MNLWPRKTYLKLVISILTLAVLISGIRIGLAVNVVQQIEVVHSAGLDLGATTTLRILPLFDAWARTNDFQSGHGVSYLNGADYSSG